MKTKKFKKTATSTRLRRSRFINCQRHRASCGPIAAANVIKWLGIETSYRKVLKFSEAFEFYMPGLGMAPLEMGRLLKKLEIPYRLRRTFTIAEIDAHLDQKGSIVLVHGWTGDELHCVFVDARIPGLYRVWNAITPNKPWVGRKELVMTLRRSRPNHLFVYLIPPISRQK